MSSRCRVFTMGCVLCMASTAMAAGCAGVQQTPRDVPVNHSAMDAPKRRLPPMINRTGQVQLNPNELVLPEAAPDATAAQRDFVTAATHAVRQTYQADNDDPSVLQALLESLHDSANLRGQAVLWREILQSALARAQTLQAVGPALRLVRESLRAATLEPGGETIQGMDLGLCHNAFTSPIGRNRAIDGILVTFESLGTFSLGQVREACDVSSRAALQKSRLPGKPAAANVSRMVRKLFADAHLGGEVRKVVMLTPWHKDRSKHAMAMRAAVGIFEPGDDNAQTCTMARVAVIRSLRGNTLPALVELGAREPILCSQLR